VPGVVRYESSPDETVQIRFDDEKTSLGVIIEALGLGGFTVQGTPEFLSEGSPPVAP
jgi:hypothetical protein